MEDEENIMNEDNNDDIIDDFCQKANSEEFKGILSAKEIHSNFESMNEILETLNETKIFYENPQLRIINSIKPKLHIITPKKDLIKEDHDSIKDIKIFQNGYEESADEIISTVENVKINFADLSKSVKGLIDAIEQTKIEYFDTIKEMINPMIIEIENIEKVDTKKFNKEKLINFKDMKEKLDKRIKLYDQQLATMIKDKKEILSQVNGNIQMYLQLLNSLDKPVNSMLEKIEALFNNFENKSNEFIKIIYNYTKPEEKTEAIKIFREIQKLNNKIVAIVTENENKLHLQNNEIKNKKVQCTEDLDKIRTNNMISSEKLPGLIEEKQNIMKEINELLKFLNKKKIIVYERQLKGLQLFHIKKQVIEGTEKILRANQKLEADSSKLKKFVKEKIDVINKVFTLDLAFIIDITGSMGSYLDFAKKQILNIINKIMEDSTVIVRLGFVGYRDYLDSKDPYIIYNKLTKKVEKVKEFISSAKVEGGGDCEDMGGGLTNALNYKWKSNSRFAILIADVPCHGEQYHGITGFDSYPKGDDKYKIDEIIQKIASQNINLMCLNIKDETKKLYENFKLYYKKGQKPGSNSEIIVKDFREEPSKLSNIIVTKAKEFYSKRHETTM